MVNREEFAARLGRYIDEAGVTQQDVADAAGVSQASVWEWVRGESVPRRSRWKALTDYLSEKCQKAITVEHLFYGKTTHIPRLEEIPYSRIVELKGRVPLISWSLAGNWKSAFKTFHPGDAERWLHVTEGVGAMAFALRVQGDSMEPVLPTGVAVVIDPEQPVEHGSIVLASVDGAARLRQYWLDGEEPYLRPTNDKYPTFPARDAEIIGVAVEYFKSLLV